MTSSIIYRLNRHRVAENRANRRDRDIGRPYGLVVPDASRQSYVPRQVQVVRRTWLWQLVLAGAVVVFAAMCLQRMLSMAG